MNTLIVVLLIINIIIAVFACWQRSEIYDRMGIRYIGGNFCETIPPMPKVEKPAGKYVTVEEFNTYLEHIRVFSVRYNEHIECLHGDIPHREYFPTGNVFTPIIHGSCVKNDA